jgi:hypothetical protein
MRKEVERRSGEHWPPNQWHPAYASIKEWLENEAPVASPLVVDALGKARNQKVRFRILRRTK